LNLRHNLKRISEFKNIDGWLTDNEAYGLYSIAKKIKSGGVIVEIGSWKGKSTYCLAKGLRYGKLFAIDPFNAQGEPGSKTIYEEAMGEIPLIEQFITKMNYLGVIEKIVILKGYSNQFINNFEQIDLLFIDGDHSQEGCDFDFLNYAPKIKKNGLIAFHDYDPNREDLGPTWVINHRILNSDKFRFLNQFDSLWIAQKVKI